MGNKLKSGMLVGIVLALACGSAFANDPFLKEAEAIKKTAKPKAKKKPKAKAAAKKAVRKRFVQKRRVTLPRFRPETDIAAVETPQPTKVAEPAIEVAVAEPNPPVEPKPAMETVRPEKVPAKSTPKKGVTYKAPKAVPDTTKVEVETPVVEPEPKVMAKVEPKPVAKAEAIATAKVEPKPKAVSAPKPAKMEKPKEVAVVEPVKEVAKVEAQPKQKPEPKLETKSEAVKVEAVAQPVKMEEKAPEAGEKTAKAKPEENPEAATKAAAPEVTKKPVVEETTTKVAKVEPQVANTEIATIDLGERPTTFTKALRDKRLRKLPGLKTRGFKKEEVIAIRHHALMLLKSKECRGVTKGGRTSIPGTLFVVCVDDPTYIRQFPLEEQSW